MRLVLFSLLLLGFVFVSLEWPTSLQDTKTPQIAQQWNATIQFNWHGVTLNGQIYQDRDNFNKTRVDAEGGGLTGSSIYDTNKGKGYNFGHGQDCYVAHLTNVETALLTWEWLKNATTCEGKREDKNCYSYSFNKGQVKMWFKNDIPTKYEFSEGPVQFSFEVTGWVDGPQNASHFQVPSYC